MNVSGDWVLDEHDVQADIPSKHGKITVTVYNDELPLPAPAEKSNNLADGETTKIFYDSKLSVDCLPDDAYETVSFYVNGIPQNTKQQYVFLSSSSNNKTRDLQFNISAVFKPDWDFACLSVVAVNGTPCKFRYSDVPQPLAYQNNNETVQEPFSSNSNTVEKDSVLEV